MIELDDVRAAAKRIQGRVRRTPLLAAAPMRSRIADGYELVLKLECLQVTGSFKARGAISKLASLSAAEVARGLITASGGNHGAAVAYAGWVAGTPATVFVPDNVAPLKVRKIEGWGARLEVEGSVWDESNRAALAFAEREGLTYVHPFADPAVMAGQGTVALEILEQDAGDRHAAGRDRRRRPDRRHRGRGQGAEARDPDHRGRAGGRPDPPRERPGGPRGRAGRDHHRGPDHGRAPDRGGQPRPRPTPRRGHHPGDRRRDAHAARLLWLEHGLAADLSGAASLALLTSGKFRPRPGAKVCALICGAGTDGLE